MELQIEVQTLDSKDSEEARYGRLVDSARQDVFIVFWSLFHVNRIKAYTLYSIQCLVHNR